MERIMAKDDISGDTGRVWELMKKIGFAMLVTRDGNKLRARPMSACLERDEKAIYFLTDARRHKDEEIARDPNVNLSFADPGSQKYVAVTGTAAISNDRARIKELWSPFAKAWWKDENDPAIRLLTVWPEEAEIWEGPNRLVAGAIMLAAAATGKRPPVGDHGAVRM
jgi:general stress protein 26